MTTKMVASTIDPTCLAMFVGASAKAAKDMLPSDIAAKVNNAANAMIEDIVFGFQGASAAVARSTSIAYNPMGSSAGESLVPGGRNISGGAALG